MKCKVTCTCLYIVSHTRTFLGIDKSYILLGVWNHTEKKRGGGYTNYFLQYVHNLSLMNKNKFLKTAYPHIEQL